MNKIPKDIDKWDSTKWMQQVVNCRPSSGGAVGVIFVWAGMAYSRQNLQDSKMAAFVIKPIQGSAAPTKFAEHLLSKIAGARSPNSQPIARRSPSGSGLMLALRIFRDRENDPVTKARWKQIFTNYDRADTFLIQETQIGIKEFGDAAIEQSGLATMLLDQQLMTNLGRLFAVDTLLGNGDRVGNMNMGNIIFKADGTLCSIDSTTVLTDYEAVMQQSRRLADMGFEQLNLPTLAANAVTVGNNPVFSTAQEKQFMGGKMPAVTPTSGMMEIFDVDVWWERTFKPNAVEGLTNRTDEKGNPLPDFPMPPEIAWSAALGWFKLGVETGIRDIDAQLSGLNWLLVKNSYFRFVTKYGGDPNLDWTNFKLRRRYIKLRNRNVPHEQALVTIKDYAARKFPGL